MSCRVIIKLFFVCQIEVNKIYNGLNSFGKLRGEKHGTDHVFFIVLKVKSVVEREKYK